MNKTSERLKEKTKEIFNMELKLKKLYEERREILSYIKLSKQVQ